MFNAKKHIGANAFTLVELIVVIVMLAILATIAFLSFDSHASSARDSSRLSDLRIISKSLELVKMSSGKYPDPGGDIKKVTFSGSEIWTQGTFGDSAKQAASSISKVPRDPIYGVEYTYSVLNTDAEYQLSAMMERKRARNEFVPFGGYLDAFADQVDYQAMTIGTYNGMAARVFTGGIYYILAIPSIIAADPPVTVADGIGVHFVLDSQGNLPDSYLNTSLSLTGGGVFRVSIVMSSSKLELSAPQVVQMTKNLQIAYSGSDFISGAAYQDLLGLDAADNSALLSFGTNIVKTQLGGTVDLGTIIPVNPNRLSVGYSNSCYIMADKTVRCWGDNNVGQLGDGTTQYNSTPVTVSGLSNAVSLSIGGNTSCALVGDGTVKCWGYNGNGQLGDGTIENRSVPVMVSGLYDVVSISVGSDFVCALIKNGTVKCWGAGISGRLGNNAVSDSRVPVLVYGLTNAIGISSGYSHSCALLSDKTIKCWGVNATYQIGDIPQSVITVPVTVADITDAIGVSVGWQYTCALLGDGTVKCWGRTYFGDDTASRTSASPVTATGITNATKVVTGSSTTCAKINDGTVKCWGINNGAFGNGIANLSQTPTQAYGLSNIEDFQLTYDFSCALLSNGGVKCSGRNHTGQMGDGTTSYRSSPVSVLNIP